MYELLHPNRQLEQSLAEYRKQRAQLSEWYGKVVGFTIDQIVVRTDFTLVVNALANLPVGRRGSRPSVVSGLARWIREDGQWRILTPAWNDRVKDDKALPIKLRALDGRAGSVWSPDEQAVPECFDAVGLRAALGRLLHAVLSDNNAVIYGMLASQVKAETSFAEFDHAMKALQADWLKPQRLHSVSRPELVALVTLHVRPSDWLRTSLTRSGLKPMRDDVWPCWYRPELRLRKGTWFIWRG